MSERPPQPVWPQKKPPPEGDHEPPPKPKRYWWRFTLASVVIVAVTAAATAISILLYVGSIATALSHHNHYGRLHRYLSQVHGGAPENILIIGSDKRANLGETRGRSDTTILLRLDPDRNAIAVMSIPRDLKVDIPGVGVTKFNAAYTYGGPKLTLRVVKELTGLQINHIVNVDFLGFVRAVNALGCVYTNVDRRYYHSNEGLPPSEQYSEIDIQPGYQLLCGREALAYVRYRHTDTDLVRSARQQEFLSDARSQVPISQLVLGQNDLIDIFTKYTTSDIANAETMLQVLKLFIAARNANVEEVHFPATLGPSYVYASESAIHGAVNKFLGVETEAGGSLAATGGGSKPTGGHARKKAPKVKPQPSGGDGLVPASEAGEAEAKQAARKLGRGFPVFYPTRLPAGAVYVEDDVYEHEQNPRVYRIKGTDGHSHRAYVMVLAIQMSDGLHYFDVQGIQGWSDPPILDRPSLTETIHGRDYQIYVAGDRVKMVAWHRGDDTYWISNSLLQELSNDQMMGMARSAEMTISRQKGTAR
jgi:polyisoprenyl-teichoic acid--peptidoglycan teichoic acid transferase